MRFGTLQRVVDNIGYGRLMLVDSDGTAHSITRKLLREAGVTKPLAGDAFEFIATKAGAAQLRKIAECCVAG